MATLLRKHKNAKDGCKSTGAVYLGLTQRLSSDLVDEWKVEEEKAMSVRGEALDIYQPKYIKSKFN